MFNGVLINNVLRKFGLKISFTLDRHLDANDRTFFQIYEKCKIYTLTSLERMYSLYGAVEYIVRAGIPGDMVECGVWKGGSSMLMAAALLQLNDSQRNIYLYDTYAGMTEPTEKDIDFLGYPTIKRWRDNQRATFNQWVHSTLEETRYNLFRTGYPKEKLIFVEGRVEETIPKVTPNKIAVLRLDTDWHDSTYHELCYLFPKLSSYGVLIIDDYDFFRGQRAAVGKYFKENKINMLLNIVDGAARIGVKLPSEKI